MKFNLDAGWLHIAVTIGPDEDEGPEWRESQADALVERSGPEPDSSAELDCRPVGFRGWVAPPSGGYSATGADRKTRPRMSRGCASPPLHDRSEER